VLVKGGRRLARSHGSDAPSSAAAAPPCRQPPADRRGAKSEWRQASASNGDRDLRPLIEVSRLAN